MNKKTIKYAKAMIDVTAQENGITTLLSVDYERLYICFRSGKTLELSENEVKFQAIEYLQHELNEITS